MRTIIILFFVFFCGTSMATDDILGLAIASPADEMESPEGDEGTFRRPLIWRFGEFQKSFDWEIEHRPPSCVGMSASATTECYLVREAQSRAENIHLSIIHGSRGELRREFVLVAYDKTDHTWHDIMLHMRIDVGRGHDATVKTPGYDVVVLRGLTLNQMVFDVRHKGRDLLVYAAKHLSVPVGTSRSSILSLKLNSQPVLYMATPDHLNLPEFDARGRAYALRHIREALETLHDLKIESRAFPGKLVADVVSDKLLLNVIAIEQADPYRMFGEKNERLISGDSSKEVVSGVFVRFTLNGLRAYHYICSRAAACGAFQFTNNGKLGTYDLVRKSYPKADLDPKYLRGALSFVNGAKAAALLIDLELSNKNLPNWVRELYLRDPRFGALFPIAAYNGGASQSVALADLYKKLEKKLGVPPELDTIPWDWEPLMRSYKTGKPLKKETAVYLRKYQITTGLLK